jgi:putative ABC transport system ATP-binding protein
VGLIDTISSLDKGLDTPIAYTGWPLSAVEVQQLKLANALLERPRILVLSQLFDLVEEDNLARAIRELRSQSYSTVIYFSGRRTDLGFDQFLFMEAEQQRSFDNFGKFLAAQGDDRDRVSHTPRLYPAPSATAVGEG